MAWEVRMAERLFRVSVMDGPLAGYEAIVPGPPGDVIVRDGCRCELWDIEDTQPQRWVYRCACDRSPSDITGDLG
jgi:hypothetical protein